MRGEEAAVPHEDAAVDLHTLMYPQTLLSSSFSALALYEGVHIPFSVQKVIIGTRTW